MTAGDLVRFAVACAVVWCELLVLLAACVFPACELVPRPDECFDVDAAAGAQTSNAPTNSATTRWVNRLSNVASR
jgi:hypothetical protein